MTSASELPPLREVIDRFGLSTRKALGQHFLLDANLTDKIVRFAGNLENTHVLEVGPGPGGLTRSLLHAGAAHVSAVEMDSRCVEALQGLVSAYPDRLNIIGSDALQFDAIATLPAPRAVVANLPYNVGTELLFRWLEDIHTHGAASYTRLVLMFQKEVAERITAAPGSKAYGKLSIMTQWLCEANIAFDIPARAFFPPPKVDSSVVVLAPRQKPLVDVEKRALEKLVNAAFQQRRKMLRSGLKSLGVDTEALLRNAGINPTERAEKLDIAAFGALVKSYNALNNHS